MGFWGGKKNIDGNDNPGSGIAIDDEKMEHVVGGWMEQNAGGSGSDVSDIPEFLNEGLCDSPAGSWGDYDGGTILVSQRYS